MYTLTTQDRDFITITLKCTVDEITAENQARVSGEVVEPTYRQVIDFYRNEDSTDYHLFLDYALTYTMKDPGSMTVGDRDKAVLSVVNPLVAYLQTEPIQNLENGKDTVRAKLSSLSDASTGPIHFEISVNTFMVE